MKHIALITLFLAFTSATSAGELYLDVTLGSKHLHADSFIDTKGQERNYNEKNRGIGVTYAFSDHQSASIGTYKNSIYNTTNYIAYKLHTDRNRIVSVGVNLGIITGYGIKYLPVAVPYISVNILPNTALEFTYAATKRFDLSNSDVIGFQLTSKLF